MADAFSITVAVHPTGERRVEITGPTGTYAIDIPIGFEVRVVPPPIWRRVRTRVRLWVWRVRVWMGARP